MRFLFLVFLFVFHVQAQPVYVAIMEPTYPPYQFLDESGNVVGLEVDILQAIAEEEGFTLEVHSRVWDTLFKELVDKKAHIIANGIALTDLESEDLVVSESYFMSPNCLAYIDSSLLDSWQSHRVNVIDDPNLHQNLLELFAAENVKGVPRTFIGMRNVATNQADFLAGNCNVMRHYAGSESFKRHGIEFLFLDLKEGEDTTGIETIFALHQDDQVLLLKINSGLKKIKENGKLREILRKWRLIP